MKALVLGGYGTVGAVIVNTLRAAGDVALVAGRDPARADRVVDLHDPDTLGSATRRRRRRGQRLGNRDPDAVAALTEFGSAVVDISHGGVCRRPGTSRPCPPGAGQRRAGTRADEPARRRRPGEVAIRPDRHRRLVGRWRAPRWGVDAMGVRPARPPLPRSGKRRGDPQLHPSASLPPTRTRDPALVRANYSDGTSSPGTSACRCAATSAWTPGWRPQRWPPSPGCRADHVHPGDRCCRAATGDSSSLAPTARPAGRAVGAHRGRPPRSRPPRPGSLARCLPASPPPDRGHPRRCAPRVGDPPGVKSARGSVARLVDARLVDA
jgi:hypothetical protein